MPFVVNEGLKLTKMPLLGKPGKQPLKVVGNKCFGRNGRLNRRAV
ncbi:hypothetical protein HanXRQr2_Chr12g0530431 [Helianthus annuus]|uniref:Uncharacterized protein n=1 Tax=Helianthus annuus TaxID=4232 RepID=A0A9K3HEX6_HELAN|nr:hypothetical protein HanXRQr2_Chr12g0530431 [Helianthus annuus]KAJ0861835.1 hypothetical protein HanPSC8_Chr12g0511121 [Helianthus annuus]